MTIYKTYDKCPAFFQSKHYNLMLFALCSYYVATVDPHIILFESDPNIVLHVHLIILDQIQHF